MANDMDRVVPLEQLDDFVVAEGDPDVRGWEVVAADGRAIGEVDDLLIDTAAMKVRYLDVDLDESLVAANDDRHILIPIGYARLDEERDRVLVDALSSDDLVGLPEYSHEPLTREYETDLRRRLDTGYDATGVGTDFYAHQLYDQDRFFGGRRGAGAERMGRGGEAPLAGDAGIPGAGGEPRRAGDVGYGDPL